VYSVLSTKLGSPSNWHFVLLHPPLLMQSDFLVSAALLSDKLQI
jgi:hypothetical protein